MNNNEQCVFKDLICKYLSKMTVCNLQYKQYIVLFEVTHLLFFMRCWIESSDSEGFAVKKLKYSNTQTF